ncbi:MAG TPA: phytanoyl-CoA dioxygenase family protein [Acidobacteriota bacterium]|nr:phytanoyl-CoA dioxygenase family protein [Acidobacteriota bacterium]
MHTPPLTDGQVEQFHRDGYVICRGYFEKDEMDLLLSTARADHRMLGHNFPVKDSAGRESKLSLWNHPGNDIYGMIARCRRIVDAMEQLLGGEVYHYHSKMMLKEPEVGGAWEWHQDYGYWYQNGCLLPDMASCLIAVDRATKENGCLQLLKASHRMGRIDHGRYGEQTGADPERVREALKHFELLHFEAEPGDALFFHSNLLHCSAPNGSPNPRWSLICCYNTRENDPFREHHHPRYTPLVKVDDSMIRLIGARGAGVDQESFLDPSRDRTTGAGKTDMDRNPRGSA